MTYIQNMIQNAYDHSEGFQKRLNEAELTPDQIISQDDLTKIPILKKDDLPQLQDEISPFGGFTTIEANKMARVFMSPGPIYDPQPEIEDYWRFSEALKVAGFHENDIVQNTFSYHLSPAGFMFDSALRKLGATVIPAGTGNRELQLEVMRTLKVTAYVGTPSFFSILLDEAEKKGWSVGNELNLEKVFFTGEMVSNELREKCDLNDMKVYEGYGTADCGCIAYDDKSGPGLHVSNSIILQLCDPITGKEVNSGEGEIVVTLYDKSYPLIRFGTGDLSKWVEGYEGTRIVGILGRVSDGIKVRGMFVREKQLSSVLVENGYENFDAIISNSNNYDQLEIRVEANGPISEDLVSKIQEVIRVKPIITVVSPGTIRRGEKKLIDERVYDMKKI